MWPRTVFSRGLDVSSRPLTPIPRGDSARIGRQAIIEGLERRAYFADLSIGTWNASFPSTSGGGTASATADISNDDSGGVSGSLRLQLQLSSAPYGQQRTFYTVSEDYPLTELNGGFHGERSTSDTFDTASIPDGTYQIVLVVSEFDGSTYSIRDGVTDSDETYVVGSPTPSPTPTPTFTDLDDEISEAIPLTFYGLVSDTISSPTDVDLYRISEGFSGRAAFSVSLSTFSSAGPRPYLRLFAADGSELASAGNSPGDITTDFGTSLFYDFAAGAKYYVGVSAPDNHAYDPLSGEGDVSNSGSGLGPYTAYLQTPIPTPTPTPTSAPIPVGPIDGPVDGGGVATKADPRLDRGPAAGQFGSGLDRKSRKVTYTDADGTLVSLSLTGGVGTFYVSNNTFHVDVIGASATASLTIAGKGGDGRVRLGLINVQSSLKAVVAKTSDLVGTLYVGGSVDTLVLGSLTGGTLGVGGDVQSLSVRGGIATSAMLLGASLGTDGVLGTFDGLQDTFGPSVVRRINVTGGVAGSAFGVGVSPGVDGDLGTIDDEFGAGAGSMLTTLRIKGGTDILTTFSVSGGTPKRVALPKAVDPLLDPRFRMPILSVSISGVSVIEKNACIVDAPFVVTLSFASATPVTVDLIDGGGGTASAGTDYGPIAGQLTFQPGVTSLPFPVNVFGDTVAESDETFRVGLVNPVGATVARATALATIIDDDDDRISGATFTVVDGTTPVGRAIDSLDDVDMFAFDVTAGQTLYFDVDLPAAGLDSFLRLFDAAGNPLAGGTNDDGQAPDDGGEPSSVASYLSYAFAAAGRYYVGVSNLTNNGYDPVTGGGDVTGGSTGPFRLFVRTTP
jgi:hypothetical protein